ncbi:MAG: sulfite exporter TauE/SafE family protein [Alphaproteobacteria bacterium]
MNLADLASAQGIFLLVTTFIAALLSTSVGAGGGLLLVGLATVMPAPTVIPTHACIMLAGSFFGWNLLRKFANYALILPFVVGSIIGLGLAVPLVGQLSHQALALVLGSFLLFSTWGYYPASLTQSRHYPWQCGLVTSFLSVFVGATRPMLLTMFGRAFDDHKVVVATVNACAALQHVGKIVVFVTIGASFIENWQIIGALIVVTMLGSLCGRHLLIATGQGTLKLITKLLITALALNLILDAMGWTLWGG